MLWNHFSLARLLVYKTHKVFLFIKCPWKILGIRILSDTAFRINIYSFENIIGSNINGCDTLKMECYGGIIIFLHIVTRFWLIKWSTICVDILNICMSYDMIFIQKIAPPPSPTTTTTTAAAATKRKVYTNRYLFSFPLTSISSFIKGSIISKMLDDVEFRQYPALAAVTTSILLHHKTYTSYVYRWFYLNNLQIFSIKHDL